MSWENDERGKPCKWQRSITVEDAERTGLALPADKIKAIDDALKECITLVSQLRDSSEYVVIVEPQLIQQRDIPAAATIYIVRARVRWVTPEAKANRERNLGAMFEAADDELRITTERGLQSK